MPAKEHTRGRHPGPAFPGISRLLPLSFGAGEERRRRGRGGGDRRIVHDEIPGRDKIRAGSPGLRPSRALATRTPAPAREPSGGPVWFSLPGREFPPRPPPPGDCHHGPVHGMMPAKEHTRGRLPGPAIPEISRLLPPPRGGGGAPKARVGWGRDVQGHLSSGLRPARALGTRTLEVASPRLRLARALVPRTPAPAREPCGRAGMVFVDGEGVPSPSPSPGDIPTVRCMG